ncbi:MAG: hypothetical protein ACOYKA_01705 [Legionellaceae bacterium]
MSTLILHPTDLSQWHAFVNEAQASTQLILNENTESYLVFLLMRFSQKSQLMDSILAMDFLHAQHTSSRKQVEFLRDLGDKSLLFCGLFPGMASRRHVSIDYFKDMGRSAYLTLSELQAADLGVLYSQLSDQFDEMQRVLQAMRGHVHGQINV